MQSLYSRLHSVRGRLGTLDFAKTFVKFPKDLLLKIQAALQQILEAQGNKALMYIFTYHPYHPTTDPLKSPDRLVMPGASFSNYHLIVEF